MLRNRRIQHGFSLVEVAIVLVIIGVLLAGITGPLSTWRDHAAYKQTELYLEQSRKALLTFAAVKGYLPCPDTDGDGDEDRTLNHCDSDHGTLPWLDLGLEKETPWNAAAAYIVHGRADNECDTSTANKAECFFSSNATEQYNFSTSAGFPGKLNINDADAKKLVEQGVAIVISYGVNSDVLTAAKCTANSGGVLEAENCDNDETFIHTTHRTAAGNSYDDQLIWLDKLSLHGLLLAN